jgi:hypothetical protein
MNDKVKYFKKNERGQVLIFVALMMVGLIGFGALLTDGALMQVTRRELQAAADAAALAGAMELPNDPTVVVKNFVTGNGFPDATVTIQTPYKGDNMKIEVVLEQQQSFTFGRIFDPDGSTISARAVAMANHQWDGEALPFLNLDDEYLDENGNLGQIEINLWEKVYPGGFESVDKNEYKIDNYDKHQTCDKTTSAYFTVYYDDGIEVKDGTVAEKKDELQCVFLQQNDPVYVLSLNNDDITNKEVKVTSKQGNQETRSLDKDEEDNDKILKNNDVISKELLVLLECHWVSYDYNEKLLTLTCYEDYILANDEFPENYINPEGGTSNLIE